MDTSLNNHNLLSYKLIGRYGDTSLNSHNLLFTSGFNLKKNKRCSDCNYDDLKFSKHYTKLHTNIGVALKPNFTNHELFVV